MTDDLHALAAAYALDALDPDERRQFEAHFPECPTCRSEVADYRRTAGRLGALVPSPLPADLKDRVMTEVRQTRQMPPWKPDPEYRRFATAGHPPRAFPLVPSAARRRGGGRGPGARRRTAALAGQRCQERIDPSR